MASPNNFQFIRDPLKLVRVLWPDVKLYDKQREIIFSTMGDGAASFGNDRTVVPAGHMLGKDFVTGLICLLFFLTRHPCRVVTTSVDGNQLQAVLWGEIRRFIQTAKHPLDSERGGPLLINHLHIRKVLTSGPNKGEVCGLSYLMGRVAAQGEGLSGHHVAKTGDGIPRTLAVADEASGIDALSFEKMDEWANRWLIIGNPYECANEFKHAVEGKVGTKDRGGDLPRDPADPGKGYKRKVIHIGGTDSPNVKLGMAEVAAGLGPSDKILVPGVLPYSTFVDRTDRWDAVKVTVGVHGRFYSGSEVKLYPPAWLDRAAEVAERNRGRTRYARAIGNDPAEGGDKTSQCAVDELGVIELESRKTPDTNDVYVEALAFARKHGLYDTPDYVLFDRGGGGKEHADRARAAGLEVRTVGFGEAVTPDLRRGMVLFGDRLDDAEKRYAFKNRRAQMYWSVRMMIDPSLNPDGWGIPTEFAALFEQMSPIPLLYDGEGRFRLPPKHKKDATSKEVTLEDLIGHSPDELDSLALAVHGMLYEPRRHEVSGF